jgi:hypothetical protein
LSLMKCKALDREKKDPVQVGKVNCR